MNEVELDGSGQVFRFKTRRDLNIAIEQLKSARRRFDQDEYRQAVQSMDQRLGMLRSATVGWDYAFGVLRRHYGGADSLIDKKTCRLWSSLILVDTRGLMNFTFYCGGCGVELKYRSGSYHVKFCEVASQKNTRHVLVDRESLTQNATGFDERRIHNVGVSIKEAYRVVVASLS